MNSGFFQHQGAGTHYFANAEYAEECFILGIGRDKHAKLTADEITQTALLGYKLLRRKHFYWEAKERLILQLHKIVARHLSRLNQKHPGLKGTLAIACVSDRTWWFGVVGDIKIFVTNVQTIEHLKFSHAPHDVIDLKTVPVTVRKERHLQDSLLLCTPAVMAAVNEKQLHKLFMPSAQQSAEKIITTAIARRKQADYAAVVIAP